MLIEEYGFPLIDRTTFREEVRRCREEFGFTALKLQPQYHGLNPLSGCSDLFFETAMENQMAVVRHTGSGLPLSSPALLMIPARKFPSLKIVSAFALGYALAQIPCGWLTGWPSTGSDLCCDAMERADCADGSRLEFRLPDDHPISVRHK